MAGLQSILNGGIYLSEKRRERMLQHSSTTARATPVYTTLETSATGKWKVVYSLATACRGPAPGRLNPEASKTIESYRAHLTLQVSLASGAKLVR